MSDWIVFTLLIILAVWSFMDSYRIKLLEKRIEALESRNEDSTDV
jgi:hypothetical protein